MNSLWFNGILDPWFWRLLYYLVFSRRFQLILELCAHCGRGCSTYVKGTRYTKQHSSLTCIFLVIVLIIFILITGIWGTATTAIFCDIIFFGGCGFFQRIQVFLLRSCQNLSQNIRISIFPTIETFKIIIINNYNYCLYNNLVRE